MNGEFEFQVSQEIGKYDPSQSPTNPQPSGSFIQNGQAPPLPSLPPGTLPTYPLSPVPQNPLSSLIQFGRQNGHIPAISAPPPERAPTAEMSGVDMFGNPSPSLGNVTGLGIEPRIGVAHRQGLKTQFRRNQGHGHQMGHRRSPLRTLIDYGKGVGFLRNINRSPYSTIQNGSPPSPPLPQLQEKSIDIFPKKRRFPDAYYQEPEFEPQYKLANPPVRQHAIDPFHERRRIN